MCPTDRKKAGSNGRIQRVQGRLAKSRMKKHVSKSDHFQTIMHGTKCMVISREATLQIRICTNTYPKKKWEQSTAQMVV
jgi:hypothetical protein